MQYYRVVEGASTGEYVEDFEPTGADYTRTNHQGVTCYHRGVHWYVPFGRGMPSDSPYRPAAARRAWGTPYPKPDSVPESTYADGNPKSAQGAKKYSLRHLPLPAAIEVNRALEDGRNKYGAANWRQTGVAATVYVDAALRHLAQWYDGQQEHAADSGVHNLGHAMACLAILIDAQANGSLQDDRPFPCKDTDNLLLRVKHEPA